VPIDFFDWFCHLYVPCLLRQLFLAAYSEKLFSSPQRAHVTFFVKRDKLELACWLLCSGHAVIQVPPDGVVTAVTVVAISSQPALLM